MNTTSELVVSWAPPKKRGGSLANHAISITYSPASSCNISIRSWFLIYSRIIFSSSRPTVLTQYPRAQNVRPRTMRLLLLPKLIISDALLPFKRPMTCATEYFGGIETQRWIWSGIAWPSMISIPLIRAHCLIVSTTTFRFAPYSSFRLYFRTHPNYMVLTIPNRVC